MPPKDWRWNDPGRNASEAICSTMTPPAHQASGRQRGDRSLPVGKSKGRKVVIRPHPGSPAQSPNQAAATPPGSEPGAVTNVYTAYCPAKNQKPISRPTPQNIQPIELPGWRDTIKAPTAGNARNPSVKKPKLLRL